MNSVAITTTVYLHRAKVTSVGCSVFTLGHILIPNQPVFPLTHQYCEPGEEAANTNCIVPSLTRPKSNSRSASHEANTITITSQVR
jgi:hypothetical protein